VSTYSSNDPRNRAINLPADLYVMRANGTLQTRLISDGLNHWNPSWSHDGKKFAFAAGTNSGGNAPSQIYAANADGGNVKRLTRTTSVA
jgi:Tol biopolymer transport system component